MRRCNLETNFAIDTQSHINTSDRATNDLGWKAMSVIKRFCILHHPILLDHLCNVTVPPASIPRA